MKHMRAVESDSVKSARKAIKGKLHKPFKEHQKLVSELCETKQNVHGMQV